jgi:selenide,water dikinase
MSTSDDAGVFRINEDTAIVQTLDFFTPIVNSPYDFGRIAAANSLSDIYAMGAIPLTAMNIVCFPEKDMDQNILKETLEGGLEKIYEADAHLVGGHSVDDNEFKYGLSVTGKVHPKRFITNFGANIGDKLILTKPIGTGILATAIKGKIDAEKCEKTLVKIASELNKKPAEIMLKYNPSACTDVTGFGLAGHLLEMAKGGKKEIRLFTKNIIFIPEAYEYASIGLIPAGAYSVKNHCEKDIKIDKKTDKTVIDLIFDPQTSGGLITAINPQKAETCLKEMIDNGIAASLIGEIADECQSGRLIVET